MAFFKMASTGSTEPDLMGGSAGTYSGSRTGGQATLFPGSDGGNAVTSGGLTFRGGLVLPGAGTYEFGGTSPFSISYWVQFASVDTTFSRHLGTERSSNGWMATSHPTAGISFTRFTSSGAQEVYKTDGSNIVAGAWYHCCGIFTGSTLTHIVNGQNSGPSASTGSLSSTSSNTLKVGGTDDSTKTATICDFGVWNRALTADEAAILFKGPKRAKVAY